MNETTILVTAAAIAVLLLVSAFFSGSETALTAAARARIHHLEQRGNPSARRVARLLGMRERLLGAILLGNNLVNILASVLATHLFVQIFGGEGVVWATIVMTLLVVIFAEVMPKTYAITDPERAALRVSGPISVVVAVFAPVTMAVEVLVQRSLAMFGADTKGRDVLSVREELRGAIHLHHAQGAFVKGDRDMLGGILDLSDLEVSDIMVHRTAMKIVDAGAPVTQVIEEVLASGHTRLPLWEDEPDNIIGVVHAKDILRALTEHRGNASAVDVRALAAQPWFVPDTTSLTDQLDAFLKRKAHFAIVVDEYGEVMGLITLEDILEVIVGEISDEHDPLVEGVRKQPNGAVNADGWVAVRDINRAMDWQLPDDEANTIAGLIIHEAQTIPDVGQIFTFHGFRFEVLRRQRNRITSLRITPLKT